MDAHFNDSTSQGFFPGGVLSGLLGIKSDFIASLDRFRGGCIVDQAFCCSRRAVFVSCDRGLLSPQLCRLWQSDRSFQIAQCCCSLLRRLPVDLP